MGTGQNGKWVWKIMSVPVHVQNEHIMLQYNFDIMLWFHFFFFFGGGGLSFYLIVNLIEQPHLRHLYLGIPHARYLVLGL